MKLQIADLKTERQWRAATGFDQARFEKLLERMMKQTRELMAQAEQITKQIGELNLRVVVSARGKLKEMGEYDRGGSDPKTIQKLREEGVSKVGIIPALPRCDSHDTLSSAGG